MDGIGPGDLQIDSLVQRVAGGEVKEVVLALSTTMEEMCIRDRYEPSGHTCLKKIAGKGSWSEYP